MTRSTVRIGTRPKRGQSYDSWQTLWSVIFQYLHPFETAGALRGYPADEGIEEPLPCGHRLSGEDLARWHADAWKIVYVVVSYSTPIAWMTCEPFQKEEWYLVKEKFSPTTSKHQSLIRQMVNAF